MPVRYCSDSNGEADGPIAWTESEVTLLAVDIDAFVKATFSGCGANVSPLIGIELTLGAMSVETLADVPTGDLAVLPISLEIDGVSLGGMTLHTPLAGVAAIGRRMLGDEEPDKERELSADDLDAVGEVLNLWSGAIDAAVRAHVNPGVRSRPVAWWRSAEPGTNAFDPGPREIARAALIIPGGIEIPLHLRFSTTLITETSTATAVRAEGSVLLLGLDAASSESLSRVLSAARLQVRSEPLEAPHWLDAIAGADVVLLDGEPARVLAACRQLRLGNATWRKPAIVCMNEATRQRVTDALFNGATSVLCLPASDTTLLRVMKEARG